MLKRALLFDFGGTLDSDGISWPDRFYTYYTRHWPSLPRKTFEEAFYYSDDHLAQRFDLSGLGLKETLTLQVRGVVDRLSPAQMHVADKVASTFLAESRNYFARNIRILQRLSDRFSLAIVSNFYGNLESVLESEGLRPHFQVISDSGALGTSKPDEKIFNHTLQELKTPVEQACMIGDSLNRDMRGAEALDIQHLWLRGAHQQADSCCDRGKAIKSLEEAADQIDSIFAAAAA